VEYGEIKLHRSVIRDGLQAAGLAHKPAADIRLTAIDDNRHPVLPLPHFAFALIGRELQHQDHAHHCEYDDAARCQEHLEAWIHTLLFGVTVVLCRAAHEPIPQTCRLSYSYPLGRP